MLGITMTETTPPPSWISRFVTLISGVVLTSALALIVISLIVPNRPWFLLGFELVTAFAAVFGVLAARKKFVDGFTFTVAAVAIAVGVAALLGYLGAGKAVNGVSLYPLLWGRAAAAVVLGLLAGLTLVARDPKRSMPAVAKTVIFGALFGGVVAVMYLGRGRFGSLGWDPTVKAFVVILVSGVALGLLAAAVHFGMRALSAPPQRRV